ncbi:MAG: trypsin-like peptidase domain-containing protein [Desulfuromonadales bacterium]
MSSDKNTESTASTVQHPGQSCTRNYKPWIWALVAMSLITIVWALYEGSQQDGYVNNFLSRSTKSGKQNTPGAQPAAGGYVVPMPQAPGAVGDVQTSYHGLIDAVRPAVVSIGAAMRNVPNVATQGIIDQFPADVAFNRIGSGVIIDPRGYLLSSYHVIAGAEALKVTVYGPGGATEYPLKMVKGDLRTDMALLRIQGTGPFPHASLGDSDAARTGDMVLTIGSPFGLEQSVTSGMISSRNRNIQVGNTVYENLIQTDSAINSGSSGGPMLNTRGEVIGINTAIFAPTGVFNGIGFAIPINRAAELVGGVIDFNNTAPGAAGGQLVAWSSQGRQVGNSYRMPDGQTIMAPHGPLGACVDCHPQLFEQQAQTGTAQPVAMNGQGRLVGNSYQLPNGMTVFPPHTLRGLCTNCHALAFLEKRAKAATPAAYMTPNGMQYGPGFGRGGGFYGQGRMQGTPYYGNGQQMVYTEPLLGVGLIDVDDIICRQARMLHPEGALVTSVIPGSPAAAAGVQRGDILVRIAGRKILNIADLNTLLAARNLGRKFELVYLRNGSRQAARIRTGSQKQP